MWATFFKILVCPVSIDIHSFHLSGPWFFVLPACMAAAFFFYKSLVWVYHDAERRRKNGALVVGCILVGWPGSFIWWFAFRPALESALPPEPMPPPLPGHV